MALHFGTVVRKLTISAILLGCLSLSWALSAKVFLLPEDLVKSRLGKCSIQNKFIGSDLAAEVENEFGSAFSDRLFSVYYAKTKHKLGFFITHKVRTKKQTFYIEVDQQLKISNIEMVSFYEPMDYLAPKRWLNLFLGKNDPDSIVLNRNIPNITGATLTARTTSIEIKKHLYVVRKLFPHL